MAQKTTNVDVESLCLIYAKLTIFIEKGEAHINTIRQQITLLNDPTALSGMSGGQGDKALAAISAITPVIRSFEKNIETIKQYLNKRIASAEKIATEGGKFTTIEEKVREKAAKIRSNTK